MNDYNPLDDIRLSPVSRKRMMDAGLIARTYARNSFKRTAEILHVNGNTLRTAMRYHGIVARKKGTPVPGGPKLARADVVRATYRAYLRSDRCPPSCPGRETCLDGECILKELAR